MKKDPTKSHMGRPRRSIDWVLFEELCEIQCTRGELAALLKVDLDTLITAARKYYKIEDFSEIYEKFTSIGKCSLRRYQYVQAKHKPVMAIWLGKQWLGQKDHEEKVLPPNEDSLNMRQHLYAALYQLDQIKKEFDDFKSKASSELQPSDSSIQSVDRVSELRQDVCQPG